MAGPRTLQQATGKPPKGFHRVTCELDTVNGHVVLALDLPKAFELTTEEIYESDCTFQAHGIRVSDDPDVQGEMSGPDTYDPEITVSVNATEDGEQVLRDADEENDLFLVTDDQPFGDDSVFRSDLETDVRTFGATIGDRLAVDCFCDGQNTISRSAESAGVLVQWYSVQQLADQTDAQFTQLLATAGTK